MTDLSQLVPRMRPYAPSVFSEMSTLANELGAVNLGQGFPDTDGPEELRRIAMDAISDGSGNQYPPRHGNPDLRAAVCEHQESWYGLRYDPATDVVIGTGASELLAASVLAVAEPGDEVIILEPWFDMYPAITALSGATAVPVPLVQAADTFELDLMAIQAAITDRTRALIINTPHNPTGAVLTHSQLEGLAKVLGPRDIVVISDEVYEHLVFEGIRHTPVASVPGMKNRTITIGSGGKSFSLTGWKVGWATGPADLIAAVRVVRQHLSYVSSGPFQPAIAAGLRFPRSYFRQLADDLSRRRDKLGEGLAGLGMQLFRTDGTYFAMTDVAPLGWASGVDFVDRAAREAGVVAIAVNPFTSPDFGQSLVRWTFCKQDQVLDEALDLLYRHSSVLAGPG